jgi:hypothetical protein
MIESDSELHRAKAGANVAAVVGDGVDCLGAKLIRKLLELLCAQVLHVCWVVHSVKQ